MLKWWWFWWCPLVVLYNIAYAYISLKNSQDIGWGWFWVSFLFSIFGGWFIISKFTPANHMVFVSLLYDVLILIGFQIGLILFGATKGFNIYNWAGVAVIFIGFVLFKMGELKIN